MVKNKERNKFIKGVTPKQKGLDHRLEYKLDFENPYS